MGFAATAIVVLGIVFSSDADAGWFLASLIVVGVGVWAKDTFIHDIARSLARHALMRAKSSVSGNAHLPPPRERVQGRGGAAQQPVAVVKRTSRPAQVARKSTYRPVYRNKERISFDWGFHVMVAGPTGSGKSSVFNLFCRLLEGKQAHLLVIDPHNKPKSWPRYATVVGGGRDFDAIADVFEWIGAELDRRYELRDSGYDNFMPLYIVMDEFMAIAAKVRGARDVTIALLAEGRKVKVFMMLASQSRTVESLGAKGRGDIFENLFTIIMPESVERIDAPRIVEVYSGGLGTPHYRGTFMGRYVVPPPVVFSGKPNRDVSAFIEAVVKSNGGGVSRKAGYVWDTGINADTVSRAVSGRSFNAAFKRDTPPTRELATLLIRSGFGVRKIGEFLPMRNKDARALAKRLGGGRSDVETISIDSVDGVELALFLMDTCRAPVERVARLFPGNDAENEAYLRSLLDE